MTSTYNIAEDTTAPSLTLTNGFYYNTAGVTPTETGAAIVQSSAVGCFYGGAVTEDSGFDIEVSAGSGYLLSGTYPNEYTTKVTWNVTSLTLPPNATSYIFVDGSGVTFSDTRPDEYSAFVLSRIRTSGTGILFIDSQRALTHQPVNAIHKMMRELYGVTFSYGCIATTNTSLEIAITAGRYFFINNGYSPSGYSFPAPFTVFYHGGGNWATSSATVINNTQYDNGTDLALIPAGKFVKHVLYMVGEGATEQYFLLLAQAYYDTDVFADVANSPDPPPYFSEGVVGIASFVIEQGNFTAAIVNDIRPTAFSSGAQFNPSSIDLSSLAGVLPVEKGGTGATSLTSGNFLIGAGTSSVTSAKVAPAGTVVGTTDSQTLTNKTLQTSSTVFVDSLDATKTLSVSTSAANTSTATSLIFPSAASTSLTFPSATTTIVGTTTAQTLTNKTLTNPSISTIINTGTLSLPTSTDTLIGRDTSDTLTNKTINSATINTPIMSTITVSGPYTITLPTIGTTTLIGTNIQQFVSNKTLEDTSTLFVSAVDSTATARIDLSGAGTNSATILSFGTSTGTTTITFPTVSQTLVGTTATQTITNKTINSSTLNSPTINTPEMSTITVAGPYTLTLPTIGSATLTGNTLTQTLTNKTLTDPYINATQITGNPPSAGYVLQSTSSSAATWGLASSFATGMLGKVVNSTTYANTFGDGNGGNLIYPGSSFAVPSSVKFCVRLENGAVSGYVRLYDVTNAAVICETAAITATSDTIVSGGTISNLSTGEAIWRIQGRTSTSAGTLIATGYLIKF